MGSLTFLTRRGRATAPVAEGADAVEVPTAGTVRGRRDALRLGAVALAGGVGGIVVGASPASAGNGGNVVIGTRNVADGDSTTVLGAAGSDPAFALGTAGSLAAVSAGLLGLGAPNKDGVRGVATGGMGYGVHGRGDSGYGVVGHSSSGVSLYAAGSGRLLQDLAPWTGAPTAGNGSFLRGELLRDAAGEVWICVADGTPGTWRRLPSVGASERGGSVVMLPTPYRVVDTRGQTSASPQISGIRSAGSTTVVGVTGTSLPGVTGVPAGATGILTNLTVVSPQGNGFLLAFPDGSPVPTTSNVNFTRDQVVANSATIGLSRAGAMAFQVRGSASHVLVDVVGYLR